MTSLNVLARTLLTMFVLLLVQTSTWGQRADNGVVTGQLKGPGGAPAIGVRVAALPASDSDAQNGNALVSLAETGPDGRFRLENIPAGRYYIQAGFIDRPSYYPGVSSKASATSVVVTAGSTVGGLDFAITQAAGARVSGRVPTTLRPLSIALAGGNPIGGTNLAEVGADGYFQFLRVAPGTYYIVPVPSNPLLPPVQIVVSDKDVQVGMPAGPGFKVSGNVGLGPQSPRLPNQRVVLTGSTAWWQLERPVTGGSFEFASVPSGTYSLQSIPGSLSDVTSITVAGADVGGLVIPALVQLTGRVHLENEGSLPPSPFALMIGATRSDGTAFATATNPGGAFKLPLVEGEYRIDPGKLPPGLSVKSMSYGSIDLLTNAVKLNGTSTTEEIVLTLQVVPNPARRTRDGWNCCGR